MRINKNVYRGRIANLIFDLGNVVLNIDYGRTIAAFKSLGVAEFDSLYTPIAQKGFIDDWDKGLISSDEFRESLRVEAPILRGVDDWQIDAAWNVMLLDLPQSRLDILTRLSAHYRTFLLSNTNEIHVAHFDSIVATTVPGKKLSDYFERIYYSNETGMRKPDAEIYELVLHENGLQADETLFIDDLAANVEGAKRVGLQTFQQGKLDFWTVGVSGLLDC